MSIYGDLRTLEEMIEDCFDKETGEIKAEDDEAYQVLKKELTTDGLERLAKVRANKLAFVEGVKSEINRLKEALKREEKHIDWIENYMLSIYNESEKDKKGKVFAGTFTIGTRKSIKTIVDDESVIPVGYIVEKVEHKPDLKAIKEAIQRGETVKGCHLEEKQNISIL